MRSCSLCHAPDRPELNEEARCNCDGGDILGHTNDCQRIEHRVLLDIRPHVGPITKKLIAKGWKERPRGFNGKPALERLICIQCVRRQDDIDEMVRFRQRKIDEFDPNKTETMYQILCD